MTHGPGAKNTLCANIPESKICIAPGALRTLPLKRRKAKRFNLTGAETVETYAARYSRQVEVIGRKRISSPRPLRLCGEPFVPQSEFGSLLVQLLSEIPAHEGLKRLFRVKVLVQHTINLFRNGHLNAQLPGHIVNRFCGLDTLGYCDHI